ncbi:MAG: vWA domain-containing protein [Acidimicrobiales bacterium]
MDRRLAAVGLVLVMAAAACSSSDDAGTTVTEAEPGVPTGASVSDDDSASGDDRASGDDGAGDEASSDHGSASVASSESLEAADGAERLSDEGTAGAATSEDYAPSRQNVGLNAGWVDDNADFGDYLDFLATSPVEGVTTVDVSDRQVITVVDTDGAPIAGAMVELLAGDEVVHRARSHADGRVFAFPPGDPGDEPSQRQPVGYSVEVGYGDETVMAELDSAETDHVITLDVERQPVTALDVLFLIDATGSMSDEINRLKTNMASVADQISAEQSQVDLRFAMVTYRDHGDEYLTRTTDFTSDVEGFQVELDAVVADGGGDNPEAVDEALHEAVEGVSWRSGEAISLVFLVADAPPHLDDPQNRFDYADAALRANESGIKVFPIASSGLDGAGEYVFRQVAQLTGAPFVFLTYGADGGPGTERPEFDVDDYSVLALDQLVVRLVSEEIGHQTS